MTPTSAAAPATSSTSNILAPEADVAASDHELQESLVLQDHELQEAVEPEAPADPEMEFLTLCLRHIEKDQAAFLECLASAYAAEQDSSKVEKVANAIFLFEMLLPVESFFGGASAAVALREKRRDALPQHVASSSQSDALELVLSSSQALMCSMRETINALSSEGRAALCNEFGSVQRRRRDYLVLRQVLQIERIKSTNQSDVVRANRNSQKAEALWVSQREKDEGKVYVEDVRLELQSFGLPRPASNNCISLAQAILDLKEGEKTKHVRSSPCTSFAQWNSICLPGTSLLFQCSVEYAEVVGGAVGQASNDAILEALRNADSGPESTEFAFCSLMRHCTESIHAADVFDSRTGCIQGRQMYTFWGRRSNGQVDERLHFKHFFLRDYSVTRGALAC